MLGLIKGLIVTLKHLWRPAFTIAYPYDRRTVSPRLRARHGFRIDAEGLPLCIGCQQCVKVCPDRLIVVKTSKAPEGSPKKLQVDEVTVDMSVCMFCGLCEDVCPVDAIVLTTDYNTTALDRKDLVLDKQKLIDATKGYEKPD